MTSITYERWLREIDRKGALMTLIYLRVGVISISIEGDRRNFVSNALKKKDLIDDQMILQYNLRQYFFLIVQLLDVSDTVQKRKIIYPRYATHQI